MSWVQWNINHTLNTRKTPHIHGLVQERCNSVANTLELCLSCTNPSIPTLTGELWGGYYEDLGEKWPCLNGTTRYFTVYIHDHDFCNKPGMIFVGVCSDILHRGQVMCKWTSHYWFMSWLVCSLPSHYLNQHGFVVNRWVNVRKM